MRRRTSSCPTPDRRHGRSRDRRAGGLVSAIARSQHLQDLGHAHGLGRNSPPVADAGGPYGPARCRADGDASTDPAALIPIPATSSPGPGTSATAASAPAANPSHVYLSPSPRGLSGDSHRERWSGHRHRHGQVVVTGSPIGSNFTDNFTRALDPSDTARRPQLRWPGVGGSRGQSRSAAAGVVNTLLGYNMAIHASPDPARIRARRPISRPAPTTRRPGSAWSCAPRMPATTTGSTGAPAVRVRCASPRSSAASETILTSAPVPPTRRQHAAST